MKRKVVIGIMMFVVLAGFSVGGVLAANVDIGPDVVNMKSELGRKPAVFPHRDHQDMMSCQACHHLRLEERYMVVDNCENCHNKTMENVEYNSLKKAGHKMCMACHKKLKKEGKGTSTKCSSCHPSAKKKK